MTPRILQALLCAWALAGALGAAPFAAGTTGYLQSGGIQRRYWLHVPAHRRPGEKDPLVIALHGARGTGRGMTHLTDGSFEKLSDRDGFVVVYPDGVGKSWNDGRSDFRQAATRLHIDDVKFLCELIDYLAREAGVDPERVFCCGMSNGGFMSLRMAHDVPGRVLAVASVAASMGAQLAAEPPPASPVSVMFLLGTDDPLIPFAGGTIRAFGFKRGECLSAADSVKYWTGFEGCGARPVRTPLADKDPSDGTRATRSVWSGCKSGTEVVLVTVQGGGHTWPGGYGYLPEAVIGKTSRDFDAAAEIWSFFKRHLAARPPAAH